MSSNISNETHFDTAPIDSNAIANLRALDPDDECGLIDELIDTFLDDAPKRIEMLRESISRLDAHRTAQAAHALKGSSANFGATQLVTMCAFIEQQGRAGSLDQANRIFEEIEIEFERVSRALLAERSGK